MKGSNIETEINQLDGFLTLTRVYTELSAMRMKKTRSGVLQNRDFLAQLDDVFHDVRVSYARDVLRLGQKKNKADKDITFLSHNGKTVAVFLSANTGLYGDIIDRTFRLFEEELKKDPNMEVTLVGKVGFSYYQAKHPNRPFTYFELSDSDLDQNQLAEIIKHLVQYEEIQVYYPTFQSAVRQKPTRYTITAQTPISELQSKTEKNVYIFEPNLKEILVFFEKEIFASLMDQAIRESQLAKFASRLMTLDRAGENVKGEIKKLELLKRREKHRINNKKQLESLVSQFV